MPRGGGIRVICLLIFFFGVFAPCALAAFGSCKAGWEWANNTMQQNPCEIAGALEAACEGYSVYVLGPLAQGTNYVTPQKNDTLAQKCNCNTVMFSLYMACTACQNVTTQPWTFWSQFCHQVYVTQYPEDVPLGTAVPHWTYLNYTTGDKFDPVAAKTAGGLPEELAPVPSTIPLSSTSTRTGSSMANVPVGTPTGQGDNGQPKKSSHAGPIAGGVIGGLVFLAALGAGLWIFLRRRAAARGDGSHSDYVRVSTGAPMSEHGVPPSSLRLYDPSDPSTYPSHTDYDPSDPPYTTAPHNGHYTGAAEL